MPSLLLAVLLTAVYIWCSWIFVRDRRRGVIWTRAGSVTRSKSPRHYTALNWLNIAMLPVGAIMLLLLWTAAISRTFL